MLRIFIRRLFVLFVFFMPVKSRKNASGTKAKLIAIKNALSFVPFYDFSFEEPVERPMAPGCVFICCRAVKGTQYDNACIQLAEIIPSSSHIYGWINLMKNNRITHGPRFPSKTILKRACQESRSLSKGKIFTKSKKGNTGSWRRRRARPKSVVVFQLGFANLGASLRLSAKKRLTLGFLFDCSNESRKPNGKLLWIRIREVGCPLGRQRVGITRV